MIKSYEIGRLLETPRFRKKKKIYMYELKEHAFKIMKRSGGHVYVDVCYQSLEQALKKRSYLRFDGEAIISHDH